MRPSLASLRPAADASSRAALVLVAAAVASLAACSGGPPRAAPLPTVARRRDEGPRWIPFAGEDPLARGWVKADGLLWVEADDAPELARGRVRRGDGHVRVAEEDARPRAADDGYVLRTDHLVLRTDLPFARARALAADAEAHVGRVLALYGDALDLRLPRDPIPILVASGREGLLALVPDGGRVPVEWNAWYDAARATVYAADGPPGPGRMPLLADVRHELAHALLDLGRAERRRERTFEGPHVWLWEGAAIVTEGLGDVPPAAAGAARLERFRVRAARGEVAPLPELFALSQAELRGRHYDEIAVLVPWLLRADAGARRAGTLALLARVMDGLAETDDFERLVGLSPAEADRRFRASWEATPAQGRPEPASPSSGG